METKEIEIFRLSEIIARSMREELSDDERRVLDEWLAQDERHRTMYAAFGREEVLAEQVRLRQTIDWQGDCLMFMSRRKSWRRRKLLYRSLRYAPLFILLLSGATVWWVNSSRTDDLEQGSRLTDTRHRAFLTLAGGEQIVLSQNDTLTVPVLSQKGANIEIRENQITYSTVSAVNDNIPCNTLTTPRGREYLLTLSDGTRVWLNTESQLRYPVQFTGERRTVYLVGEAYFDVHPDASHPFTVISGPAEVTVLGTSFNLRAYPEEDIVTTLVSGAVQMSEKVGGQSVRLTPGEQGCLEKTNGYMTKREVDTYLHTAWKDGRIVFRNMRLEDLFTTLARWYDLEVFYLNPEVKDIRFTGDMDKTERFGDILRIIEQNRRVHFHVKGRTVSVSWQ